ncbi:cobalamin biosynthesis protein CobQ [Methylomonas lenta]|uniref:Cobalamin biosynthesis protein CobQ n=1 Tax=Methylomonas lenta TaxID=980561 RepID=A0A177MYV9_9GAMM|nr:ParA family protein [Methylomonas lenta]OAI10801.1 cobalamin biosynthesis protein CobQ [Methylomonas lenta]
MKIWSVSNQKGGVGKTTTVVTLGGLLSAWGFRTLLVDLDPHGSLTSYFRMNPDEVELGVYNLFRDTSEKKKDVNPSIYIAKTEFDGLTVLPASTAIATLDRQVAQMGGMGMVVATALGKLKDQYDYVIIDSPPMLGVLMINALAACDHLIIPVLAEFLAIKGLDRMVHTINMVFHSRKTPPKFTIVPTMFDKRTRAARESLLVLHQQYPGNIWNSVIPVDTRVRDASQQGVPLPLLDKNAKAVEAYSELLELLLDNVAEKPLVSRV